MKSVPGSATVAENKSGKDRNGNWEGSTALLSGDWERWERWAASSQVIFDRSREQKGTKELLWSQPPDGQVHLAPHYNFEPTKSLEDETADNFFLPKYTQTLDLIREVLETSTGALCL